MIHDSIIATHPTMDGFERYVELAGRTKTPEELFDLFRQQLSGYGYDKILFGLLSDHPAIGEKAGIGVMENYPTDWLQYYFEKGFDKVDPIVTFGAFQPRAFAWSDIPKQTRLMRKQVKCLNLGREAGLNHGISVPLRGPKNSLAGMSLASSSKVEAPQYDRDMITAYCHHFYATYWYLKQRKAAASSLNVVLTDREREILTLAAIGKSDLDIGLIMKCSPWTVKTHLRQIYRKLDADNRAYAVSKAIYAGLIHFPIHY